MRIAATESLPYLLECAKIRGEEYVANMWGTYICPNLLKAIEIEPEQSVLPEYLASFARVSLCVCVPLVVKCCHLSCPRSGQMSNLTSCVLAICLLQVQLHIVVKCVVCVVAFSHKLVVYQ